MKAKRNGCRDEKGRFAVPRDWGEIRCAEGRESVYCARREGRTGDEVGVVVYFRELLSAIGSGLAIDERDQCGVLATETETEDDY